MTRSCIEDKKDSKNTKPFNHFIAYPEILQLENERIRDLHKFRPLLRPEYKDIDIYNLDENGEENQVDKDDTSDKE